MSELRTSAARPQGDSALGSAPSPRHDAVRQVRVLVFSDDRLVREQVIRSVGRWPARDVEVTEFKEVATPKMVEMLADAGGYDVFVFDGEAAPLGGMGLCHQLKFEIYECPPVVVLTGRPQDAWLATWSYADKVVPYPLDPMALANAVSEAARDGVVSRPEAEVAPQ